MLNEVRVSRFFLPACHQSPAFLSICSMACIITVRILDVNYDSWLIIACRTQQCRTISSFLESNFYSPNVRFTTCLSHAESLFDALSIRELLYGSTECSSLSGFRWKPTQLTNPTPACLLPRATGQHFTWITKQISPNFQGGGIPDLWECPGTPHLLPFCRGSFQDDLLFVNLLMWISDGKCPSYCNDCISVRWGHVRLSTSLSFSTWAC